MSVPWPFVKSRFHFNAFSFDKVDIFTRFGLAFILKSDQTEVQENVIEKVVKKTKANRFSEDGQIRGFSKTLTSELVTPLQMG